MPIPERLKPSQPSDELVARMCELCTQIERELESGGDAEELLVEWHRHAGRQCESHEFTSYWKSTEQEEFVREALSASPALRNDVSYAEVSAVLESLSKAEVADSESHYYLSWLQAQFPNSNISDLIYWPDEWFGGASLFRDEGGAFKPEADLSTDQILAYAMEKSGRFLADRPTDVTLPFPMPT